MCCCMKGWGGYLGIAVGIAVSLGAAGVWSSRMAIVDEYKSGIVWPEPPVIDPGDATRAPSDAIVLFDGTDLSAFDGGAWEIEEGYAIVRGGGVNTKQSFGSCQMHVEFATPAEVRGDGQGRGNSGIYMMGRYEVQLLDSYDNPTYFDGQCASIYKQQPPIVNACRKPGEWQSYDIIFEAPQFAEDGALAKPGYLTVLHNGILMHHHVELQGDTAWDAPPSYKPHPDKLPIHIQDHGNPVRFRNLWIRENVQPLVGTLPTE